MEHKLYDIFSKNPNYLVGNKPRLNLYYEPDLPVLSKAAKQKLVGTLKKDESSNSISGVIKVKDDPSVKRGGMVNLAFTMMGDSGPIILFLHGVPTNKSQYYPIMTLLRSFCRCVCIDMLGMGQSQVNRANILKLNSKSKNAKGWQYDTWLWKHDSDYIHNFMKVCYGDERFIFVADDWGGGSLFHYASKYPNTLLNQIYIDPVALDGYPVNEIQAIGRTSNLDDKTYKMAMGAFDQTAIQIYKTMVHKPDDVWNQYTYRWVLDPYVDVNYSQGYTSTMNIKWNNLRNLSDRSFVLGGPQLLPYHPSKNKLGVKFNKMTADCLILWGNKDNMMPEGQRHRLRYIMTLATKGKVKVETRQVPDAGHFSGLDNPDYIASNILDYLMSKHPIENFHDIFLGFGETKIWKGDEKLVMEELRDLLKF